jgi:hypothetical protein
VEQSEEVAEEGDQIDPEVVAALEGFPVLIQALILQDHLAKAEPQIFQCAQVVQTTTLQTLLISPPLQAQLFQS